MQQLAYLHKHVRYFLCRYEVLQCGDEEKIIRKRSDVNDNPEYFVHMDDMFDTIKRIHVSTGHGGRDKMLKELTTKYANVTREAVELFKSLCVECMKKRNEWPLQVLLSNRY